MKNKLYEGWEISEDMLYSIWNDIWFLFTQREPDSDLDDFINSHFYYKLKDYKAYGGKLVKGNFKDTMSSEERLKMFNRISDVFSLNNLLGFLFRKDGFFILLYLQRKYEFISDYDYEHYTKRTL